MAQMPDDQCVSLSLSAKNRAQNQEQSPSGSALFSALMAALEVALQRCPYPPHECHQSNMLFFHPLQRGHLYFAD
jgi:hypothetical protein